jgi:hypothetical protein
LGYWVEDKYFYSSGDLEEIVVSYKYIMAEGLLNLDFSGPTVYGGEYASHLIMSAKVDLDRALDHIGSGHWSGTNWGNKESDFKLRNYRHFGKMQQIIIAQILGWDESDSHELEQMGFYDIKDLRYRAYKAMCRFLNEGI